MFTKEANLAGAVQTFLNGDHTLEEICVVYNVTIEEINSILNPPKLENHLQSIDEVLPNVN